MKAKHLDPEIMRQRSRDMWRNPTTRARLIEKIKKNANSPKHLAYMAEHNKKLWAEDSEFRKQHSERTGKMARQLWANPAYREKMSAMAVAENKKRWAEPAYREKVSRSLRRAKRRPEVRARASQIAKAVAQRPEEKAKRTQIMKQRWANPAYRAKMNERSSEIANKRWSDPAYREKTIAAIRATAKTLEYRARMVVVNKAKWIDPDYLAKIKTSFTPERRAAISAANKKRWADPKYRKRVGKNISKARRKPKTIDGDRVPPNKKVSDNSEGS
jgi:hypothetical protein